MSYGTFTDDWVAEKVLFQYVSGGNCSCCGISVSNSLGDLYQQCSDLSQNPEQVDDTENPWPSFLMNEVWQDKVKIRQRLKADSEEYRTFWKQYGNDFCQFWLNELTIENKKKLFQMPQEELHTMVADESEFKEAYRVLLLALVEQIRNWQKTKYAPDAVSRSELEFECALYVKEGKKTFIIHDEYLTLAETKYLKPSSVDDDDDNDDQEGQGFLSRFAELCGPKLLARRVIGDDEEKDDDASSKSPKKKTAGGLGEQLLFKSDRRLLRVMIFRYYARLVMAKYKKTRAVAADISKDQTKE